MKLKFISDVDKGIEFDGGWFMGYFERDGETIFSFNLGPLSVDFKNYSNYYTWLVALWMDKEKDIYEHVRNVAGRIQREYGHEATYQFEVWLKDFVERLNPLNGAASMFSDILTHALAWVNWREIAENILSNIPVAFY